MHRGRSEQQFSVLRVLVLAAFVMAAAVFVGSVWFEGAVVQGIARALYLIPEALGWVIDAL